jgi:hypothetical protein
MTTATTPYIGETQYGKDVGFPSNRMAVFMWAQCIDCGKPRWVRYNIRRKEIALGQRRCYPCGIAYREERGLLHGPLNPGWKGDNVKSDTGRKRARSIAPREIACRCGTIKTEVHHKDGNPLHNSPENLEVLCRRCHMAADGRLSKVSDRAKAVIARIQAEYQARPHRGG